MHETERVETPEHRELPERSKARTSPPLPRSRTDLEPPRLLLPAPGTRRRRRLWFRIDWELIACGLHGHELAGRDAPEIGDDLLPFVQEADGIRWHRCLRCEGWIPLAPPGDSGRARAKPVTRLAVPVRGKELRDRYVLRIIVIDRVIRVLVFCALIVGIFLFALNRSSLQRSWLKVLDALQGSFGGPAGSRSSLLGDVNRLFTIPTAEVYLVGGLVCCYTAVLAIEAFGLWYAKRWAEYLTLVETGCLVPFEIYELARSVSPITLGTFLINLVIVLYLLIAHRLFGIRGGAEAARANYSATE